MGLIIFALAVGVRVAWVLLVPTRPVGDFAMYIESARYLAEHRSLDPEFIYMPGYVGVVAVVHALGGGLLAIKMIGVVAGGVAAAAVYATTRLLFGSVRGDRRRPAGRVVAGGHRRRERDRHRHAGGRAASPSPSGCWCATRAGGRWARP